MANQQAEKKEYRVKPRHALNVRGIEAKECESVMLSDAEIQEMAANQVTFVVPAADFPAFMQDYAAGKINHRGESIQPAPEAKAENAEPAGELASDEHK